jgi:hypothetical protein
MQNLEIAPEEAEILQEVLESYLKEIDLELSRADSIEFKNMLKRRRSTLENIRAKLAPVGVATPA